MARFDSSMEAMVDVFIFETTTLLEQLDEILMKTEKEKVMGEEDINEIFRIMHTIKGSSAMMGLDNMSVLAHRVEDMFFILREGKKIPEDISHLYDLVFNASDLLKAEIELVQQEDSEPTDFTPLINQIEEYVKVLKEEETELANQSAPAVTQATQQAVAAVAEAVEPQKIEADNQKATCVKVVFEDDCQMENLRALILYNAIKSECSFIEIDPPDIEDNPETAKKIIEDGFLIKFISYTTDDDIFKIIENALNVKSYEVVENKTAKAEEVPASAVAQPTSASAVEAKPQEEAPKAKDAAPQKANEHPKAAPIKQSLISVNLNKLDQLLDMVGEIVITEAMVTSNPDLIGLKLDNFSKASRQLRKLTDELQDIVMSIRMVPLSGVFNKMNRIVRDMKIKLDKDVDLVFEGEETEVDKSIIDNLNDPLMHMVRNAMDHGIETKEEYKASGKTERSKITLSAYNTSSEVVIVVSDNGKGINPEKIMAKAKKLGILTKPEEEYTEKEICNLVMAPGFSTNETVTEYSGRGVGTDVVKKNIEKIGGSVSVVSKLGQGTSFFIKIPLSLAIVDGMEISVGKSVFTIPTNSIKESFKLKQGQLIHDTDNGEMVLVRGSCYPLVRLYDYFGIEPSSENLSDGIIIIVESDGKKTCLLADELLGEQQVVVKPFSSLLNRYNIKDKGMAGCSILGDGSITIILDINTILSEK